MEHPPRNHEEFDNLVKILESGELKKFIPAAEEAERKNILPQLLSAHDKRIKEIKTSDDEDSKILEGPEIIPKYTYRYRPIYREGYTILHYAMIFGDETIVNYLLKKGANPMARTPTEEEKTDQSFTVVHCPCYIGKIDTLKALFNFLKGSGNKEDTNTANKLLKLHYQHTFLDGETSQWKWTPLHYACGGNNWELVNFLIECGADPMEDEGRTLRYASKVSEYKIVKLLIDKYCQNEVSPEKKATLEKTINQEDHKGLTALHYACQKKSSKTVELLVQNGGDPTKEDKNSCCPLHYAIRGGAEECTMVLLETKRYSAKYIIQCFLASNFFLELIHQNLVRVTIKLLNISDTAYRKMKPNCLLHEAVLSNSFLCDEFIQIVKGLGKHCIEEKNRDGMTPMMLAASRHLHRKLSMIFHAYIELLDENMFTIGKSRYTNLYKSIVVNKDKKGLSMVHLAIEYNGSESDFEETVKVINSIWRKLDLIYRKEDVSVPYNEKDPFVVCGKCPEKLAKKGWMKKKDITPLEFAFRSAKPERAINIIEITKARTLKTVDKNIIHLALLSGIHSVDFERMANMITESHLDDTSVVESIFNLEEQDTIPLHLALKKKLFPHARIMIKLEMAAEEDQFNVVKLMGGNERENTLHVALNSSSPIDILDIIIKSTVQGRLPLGTVDGNTRPQIVLPAQSGVETHAVSKIVSKATSELLGQHGTSYDTSSFPRENGLYLEKYLNETVKENRLDIFEMLTVNYGCIFTSTFKLVVDKHQKEDFAQILVRYSIDEDLLKVLTTIVTLENGEKTIYFNELIQKMPDVALEALDRSASAKEIIKYNLLLENGVHMEDYNTVSDSQFQPEDRQPQVSTKITEHPLNLMVNLNKEKLLQHPVVKNYLHIQWRILGFWVYLLQVLIYALFLGCFSALVQIVEHPIEERYNLTKNMSSATSNILVYCLSTLSMLFWILQVTYSCVIFIVFQGKGKCTKSQIIQTFFQKENCIKSQIIKRFFRSVSEILLQLASFILVFTFCGASIYNTATNSFFSKHLWRVGLFAVIFAWTYFIKLGSKFPALGEYTLIFVSILKTFLKLAVFGFVLVMASTIVLRMLFYNPLELNSPFITFDRSIVKLITMITGEIDFQDTFGFSFDIEDLSRRNLYDRSMAYFLWIIFLVIIPILLSNMLIALAVGDAKEIHEKASIKKLELLAYWVTALQIEDKKKMSHYLQGCLNFLADKYNLINNIQSTSTIEKSNSEAYGKKRGDDITRIKKKYSEGFPETNSEMLQTIKEVTISNQSKLREVKNSHDTALQKVHNNQVYLMKRC